MWYNKNGKVKGDKEGPLALGWSPSKSLAGEGYENGVLHTRTRPGTTLSLESRLLDHSDLTQIVKVVPGCVFLFTFPVLFALFYRAGDPQTPTKELPAAEGAHLSLLKYIFVSFCDVSLSKV